MPRKKAETLEQARAQLRRPHKRGRKVERKVTSEANLSEFDRAVKRQMACFLKAQDFSYSYIADALDLGKSVVTRWFQEPEMQEMTAKVQDSWTDSAIKLMRSYAIELVEMAVQIARTADDKIAKDVIFELLDRMGMAKVNKSESLGKVINENRDLLEISDPNGLIDKLRNAPPEIQQQAAAHMEALMAITAEHTEEDVTHGVA